jgi:hypothetical protein
MTRRLRWHGRIRQQALESRLQLELGTWLEGWSVDPALLSLRLVDETLTLPPDWRWTRATSRNGSVMLGAQGTQLDALGGLLAEAAPVDPMNLGRRVGERALRALLTQFAGGAAGVIETEGVDAPTAENLDPRFGCCVFALQGKGFDARFIVDNGLFEHWVPPHRPELPAVAPRETALSREHVLLDVILDFGGATLADAQHLQVGDVLVSSTPIDSLFHLVLPDSRRLIAANLVRRGDRRAVQIDASSTTRKGS